MVNAEINNSSYGDASIQRPTNQLLNGVIDGVTRENIQSRFEEVVKTLLTEYLNDLEGLTYQTIEQIRDGNIATTQNILTSFIMLTNDADADDPTNLITIISEFLHDIVCDNTQNPLHHICNNIIDDTIIPFISTTHSVIRQQQTRYLNTTPKLIFIDYISCIMYWFGTPYLLEWCRNELHRRMLENHYATISTDANEDE
jgi:hypothetical protein